MDELVKLLGDKVKQNVSMKSYSGMRVGGTADYFLEPTSGQEMMDFVEAIRTCDVPMYVIGKGSNLIVTDKGIRGAVVYTASMDEVVVDGTHVTAGCGVSLAKLASVALKNNLKGVEFASGIPGSVGGAVSMNAGAYGGEIKDVVGWANVLSDSQILKLTNEQLKFGYRTSIIQESSMIVLDATFALEMGEHDKIEARMLELNQRRKDKQPLEYPSCGSTFRRPEEGFAGKYIMDAGLGGFKIGGAEVSPKHCGFIINSGDATACEVLELIEHVKEVVKQKFGVCLHEEVKVIGER